MTTFNDSSTFNDTNSNPPLSNVALTKIVLILGFGTPIEIIGLFTSLLTFIMFFYDRFTPRTTKHLLQFISVMDALLLFFGLGYLNVKCAYLALPDNSKLRKSIKQFYALYKSMFYISINWCEMTRNWTVVLVGIERCMVTCKPLQAYRLWTLRRTHVAIFFVCVMSGFLRIPVIMLEFFKGRNGYKHYETQARFLHNGTDCIFLGLVPILMLGFCSISIIRVLRYTKLLNGHQTNGYSSTINQSAAGKSVDGVYTEHHIQRPVSSKKCSKLQLFSLKKSKANQLSKRLNVSMLEGHTDASYNQYSVYTGPGDHFKPQESRVTSAKLEIRRRRIKVTRMLIFVFVLFVLLGVPSLIYWVLLCLNDYPELSEVMSAVHWFISLLYSTSNFFVYIAYMPKYREILRYLLFVKACRPFKKYPFQSNEILSRHYYYHKPTCLQFTCTCHGMCPKRFCRFLRRICCFCCRDEGPSIRNNAQLRAAYEQRLPRAPEHLHLYNRNKHLYLDHNELKSSVKYMNSFHPSSHKQTSSSMQHIHTYKTHVHPIPQREPLKFQSYAPENNSAVELSCASATLPCVSPCSCQWHHYLYHHHHSHHSSNCPHAHHLMCKPCENPVELDSAQKVSCPSCQCCDNTIENQNFRNSEQANVEELEDQIAKSGSPSEENIPIKENKEDEEH